jgi:hypothetical protein
LKDIDSPIISDDIGGEIGGRVDEGSAGIEDPVQDLPTIKETIEIRSNRFINAYCLIL